MASLLLLFYPQNTNGQRTSEHCRDIERQIANVVCDSFIILKRLNQHVLYVL
jgi:hypothetical protein